MVPVLAIVFILWEWWLGPERAMMPLFYFKERNIIGASIVSVAIHRLEMALV